MSKTIQFFVEHEKFGGQVVSFPMPDCVGPKTVERLRIAIGRTLKSSLVKEATLKHSKIVETPAGEGNK